jgi:hypothetical protein
MSRDKQLHRHRALGMDLTQDIHDNRRTSSPRSWHRPQTVEEKVPALGDGW